MLILMCLLIIIFITLLIYLNKQETKYLEHMQQLLDIKDRHIAVLDERCDILEQVIEVYKRNLPPL